MKKIFLTLIFLFGTVVAESNLVSLEKTLGAQDFVKEIKLVSQNPFEKHEQARQYKLQIREPLGKTIALDFVSATREQQNFLDFMLLHLPAPLNPQSMAALGQLAGFAGSLCLGMVDSLSELLQTARTKFEMGQSSSAEQKFKDLLVIASIDNSGAELRLTQTSSPGGKTWGSSCNP